MATVTTHIFGHGAIVSNIGSEKAVFNAVPDAGYHFDHWEGIYQGSEPYISLPVPELDCDLTAVFRGDIFRITISNPEIPTIDFVVTGDAPITRLTPETWEAKHGSRITVQPAPESKYYSQVAWDSDVDWDSGHNADGFWLSPATFTLVKDTTITAIFRNNPALTVQTENGTVSALSSYGNVAGVSGSVLTGFGKPVNVGVTPNINYYLDKWICPSFVEKPVFLYSGVYTDEADPYINHFPLFVRENITVTAMLAEKPVLGVQSEPEKAATIKGVYPLSRYRYDQNGNKYNVTQQNINVYFNPNLTEKHIYPSKSVVLSVHSLSEGYYFDHWEYDGETITNAALTVLMSEDRNVKAIFGLYELFPFSLSVTGPGSVSCSEGYSVSAGSGVVTREIYENTEITLTAVIQSGFYLKWNGTVASGNTLEIVLAEAVSIAAEFVRKPVLTVRTVNSSLGYVLSSDGTIDTRINKTNSTCDINSSKILTVFVSDSDYYFSGWSDGNMSNPRTVIMSANKSLYANVILKNAVIEVTSVSGEDNENWNPGGHVIMELIG